MTKRHEFLINTIGAYPEEVHAHRMIDFLGYYMPAIFIVASIIQFTSFCLYTWILHPFRILVKSKTTILPINIESEPMLTSHKTM